MSKMVTIEGTLTPAAGVVARGERKQVQHTDRIDRLVTLGFITIVDETDHRTKTEAHADEAAEETRKELGVPSYNGSKAAWIEFLESKGITIPLDENGEGPSRDGLIHIWQQYDGGS